MLEHCNTLVDNEMGIYRLDDKSTGISVGTMTNGTLTDQRAALIGMSLAKFSRSNGSLLDNAKQIKDGSASMEKIAIGYGHASVTGMAHVNVHIEDVSILDSLSFFYSNALQDGQERSTRYQDFDRFISVPSTIGSNGLRSEYKSIVKSQLTNYKEMFDITYKELANVFPKASEATLRVRTLDCTRYLIPLATKTSFGVVLSARALSKYICDLRSSVDPISTRLDALLTELFTTESDEYKSEASFLIRHLEPSLRHEKLIESVKDIISKYEVKSTHPGPEPSINGYSFNICEHLQLLTNPSLIDPIEISFADERLISESLPKYNHHQEAPQWLRGGSTSVYGYMDIGSIKDLNRHRSLSKLVPFFHQETDMSHELVHRSMRSRFFLCPYLNHISSLLPLSEEYNSLLRDTYKSIEDWYIKAKEEIGIYADIYAKRLVPQAHATSFVYSGGFNDFNYLANLRTRPGGHIQYRMMSYEILKVLAEANPIYHSFLARIDKPYPDNEREFIERS